MKNILLLVLLSPLFSSAVDTLDPEDFEAIQKLPLEHRESIYSFFSYIDGLPQDQQEEVKKHLKSSLEFADPPHAARVLSMVSQANSEESLNILRTLYLVTNTGWLSEGEDTAELLPVLNQQGFSAHETEYFLNAVNTIKRNHKTNRDFNFAAALVAVVVTVPLAAVGAIMLSDAGLLAVLSSSLSLEEFHHCIQYGVENCTQRGEGPASPLLY